MTPSPGVSPLALPSDWNPEHDVLVWFGPLEPLPPAARGPRTFAIGARPAEDSPTGPTPVAEPSDLYSAILSMRGSMPTRARVNGIAGTPRQTLTETGRQLSEALQARHVMLNTLESGGLRWVKQGLANLPKVADSPSVLALKDAYKGVPAVLVAPGPSLVKNVAQLRAVADRALIVSGTHALHALDHARVRPHLVVGTDPGDLARHWKGLDLSGVEAFAFAGTCAPETLAVRARRVFTFPGNGPADSWLYGPLQEALTLPSGGSVSCVQLSLALHLGCDPVVFIGLDLSFGQRYYAEGGLDSDARVETDAQGQFTLVKAPGSEGPGESMEDGRVRFTKPNRTLELPGWDGGTVRTSPQLRVYHSWFEANAPALTRRSRVINATEGGARIAGFEHARLADLVSGWKEPIDVAGPLDRLCEPHDPARRRSQLRTANEIQLQALEACAREVRNCRRLARAVRRTEGRLAALERAEKKLVESLRRAPIVSLVSQREILAARDAAQKARSLEENLRASERLYAVVQRGVEELVEPLRSACRDLADASAP